MSLLTIEDGIFEVKATAGDTHLGGEDLTTASWTSASRASSARIMAETWQAASELSVGCAPSVSVRSALFPLQHRPPLRLILFSRASTTLAHCLVHASKSFAWTTSVIPWAPSRSACETAASTRRTCMTWCLWEDLLMVQFMIQESSVAAGEQVHEPC